MNSNKRLVSETTTTSDIAVLVQSCAAQAIEVRLAVSHTGHVKIFNAFGQLVGWLDNNNQWHYGDNQRDHPLDDLPETKYYLVRAAVGGGKYLERCERAKGPRDACRKAFGVVYDGSTGIEWKCLGPKPPRELTVEELNAAHAAIGWHKIPNEGD